MSGPDSLVRFWTAAGGGPLHGISPDRRDRTLCGRRIPSGGVTYPAQFEDGLDACRSCVPRMRLDPDRYEVEPRVTLRTALPAARPADDRGTLPGERMVRALLPFDDPFRDLRPGMTVDVTVYPRRYRMLLEAVTDLDAPPADVRARPRRDGSQGRPEGDR